MKKMSYTYLKPLGILHKAGLSLAVLCFWCFLSIPTVNAQDDASVTHPFDISSASYKIEECDGANVLYSDDNSGDGTLYYDNFAADVAGFTAPALDTLEICPEDAWHRVKVTFTDFELAEGDTLGVYDGTIAALNAGNAPLIGSGSGVGVAKAFGGWVNADCDPGVNASGCLTFIFERNGDNMKGIGWEAWVECENRNIELSDVTILDSKLSCDDEAYAEVTIPVPTAEACDEELTNTPILYYIKDAAWNVLASGTAPAGSDLAPKNFAIGQYSIEFKLASDTTKTRTEYFSVQAPALVCNDEVIVPMGSACEITLTPDDILEQPCDTAGADFEYVITISLGEGKKAKTLGATITKKDLDEAGVSVCGGQATVRIERIYYGGGIPAAVGDCHNGEQSLYCETVLTINDESDPTIRVNQTAASITACLDAPEELEALLRKAFSATASDNCSEGLEVDVTFEAAEDDVCMGGDDETTVTATFTATDECGNEGKVTRTITVYRPNLNDHLVDYGDITTECTEEADIPTPGLAIGLNSGANFMVMDTLDLSTEDYVCGYILTYEDEDIPSTDCGSKKYRYWYGLDWCDKAAPAQIARTFIETTDTTAPVIAGVDEDGFLEPLTIELEHFSCTYDITKLEGPEATDNCSGATVSLVKIERIEDGEYWDYTGETELPCDSFRLKWIAEDGCHEQLKIAEAYQIIVIEDNTKPSAICVDQLNVSLGGAEGTRISAADVDAGSYDACGIASLHIREKGIYTDPNEGWVEHMNITCDKVHPDLQIELRVIDNKGNENICWVDVAVEDKIAPVCYDLEDEERYCDEFHNGELGDPTDAVENGGDGDRRFDDEEWKPLTGELLETYISYFGSFTCEDNLSLESCDALEVEEEYQLIEWPCGEIEIRRRHRAYDWSDNASNWAYQDIKVSYRANWSVIFPGDWEGACEEEAPASEAIITNGACDLLGVEVTERQFDVPGDACFKIERTFHIINWCTYVAGDDPIALEREEDEHGYAEGAEISYEDYADAGYFTYTQVLKVHDDVAPVVTVINPEPCINAIEYDADPYGEEDQTPGTTPFECDEEKTWTATATDCSSRMTWVGRLYTADGVLVKEVNTNEITHPVYNKESYYAEFWAYDNCGNSAGETGAPIEFWDCKKPTPYLLNGIAVELMETGMIQVWATDLNQNSFDNCTDQADLDFRIHLDADGPAPTTDAEVAELSSVVTFECGQVGTNIVYIYVIDDEGNFDFAQTYVIVQDNRGACEGVEEGSMVAGAITSATGEALEGVNLTINGGDAAMTTGANGAYQFVLENGNDYTITPEKDVNPLNGVSTFDLVLISKHILGITPFDSPYKHIAADVNKSGSITAFDMVQIRQLILNINSEFPSNDSWRFVDAQHNFNTANPAAEDFAEFHSINNLNTDMDNMNFVGVKVGDVNGNAQVNSLIGAEARTTNGTLNFNVADRLVEAGETVSVAFTSADIATAQGYQFTLNFAGLELAQLGEGVATTANFNTQLANRGVITTSWNGEATANDVLFTLDFQATASGLLSEMVSVSSDVTAAEAYNAAGELMDVNINFASAEEAGFQLAQNTPNPFKAETVIGFNLPQAGAATLKVMDIQGKVLTTIEGEYNKGYNQVTLGANTIGATGVLYYQLESADQIATKKMIIIE